MPRLRCMKQRIGVGRCEASGWWILATVSTPPQQSRAEGILPSGITPNLLMCLSAAGVRFTISTDNFNVNDDGMLDLDTLDEQRLFSSNCLSSTIPKLGSTLAGAHARQFMQALECARG